MFRFVVALYLMIVAAVGPAACCCTLTRLTTRLNEKPTTASEPAPTSCCHHGPQKQTPTGAPDRPSSPGHPDSPGCPCKQAVGSDLVGLPAAHDEAQEVSLRGALGEFFCASIVLWTPSVPASATPAFRESAASEPSVSTDELLYVFHILRC